MSNNSEVNAGTYWSAGELRTLDHLDKKGNSPQDIAVTMKRTVGGVKQRLAIIRTSYLLRFGGDSDTLVSSRKNPRFRFEKKDNMPSKESTKKANAVKFLKKGRA